MPTSVLLAVLAAAGLLALAPALVRRYDAGERIAAERANSDARVLSRDRRKRTVPGHDPVNPPREPEDGDQGAEDAAGDGGADPSPGWARVGRSRAASVRLSAQSPAQSVGESDVATTELRAWWRRRHRRILIGMLALNLLQLAGVIVLGPGFWIGFAVAAGMLLWYVRYLRLRAVAQGRPVERAALPAGTSGRRHYVPRQSHSPLGDSQPDDGSADAETDPRWPAEPPVPVYAEDGGDGADGGDDGDDPPVPPPSPPRRRGGIRGRSYESPAANV